MKKYDQKAINDAKELILHFENLWQYPPTGWNSEFIPNHKKLYVQLSTVMQSLEPFSSNKERKERRQKEYQKLKNTGKYPTRRELLNILQGEDC